MLILNAMQKRLRVVIKVATEVIMLHAPKMVKVIFFAFFVINTYVLMNNIVSKLFFREEKMQCIYSIKQFLKSIVNAEKW